MIVGTRVSGSHLTVGSVKPMMTTEDLYYKKNGGDVDPDITLSYINEKIEHLLGHFQKDFEGGVSAENLGPKFGGYGSFLPMYKCPPSNLPHKMNQQRECNVAPSGDNVPLKDEKIKSFLGHYPKDIEGGVSTENLGSKFGGSNECHPSNLPHKMNQQRECNAAPSRDNVPLEDEKNKGFLGHYPKDFEGGVSAENLGSKFGGSNKRRRSNMPHKMNQQRERNAAPSRDNVPLEDEKIKSSLGHYPKNFEGSKFGGSNKRRRSNLPHKMNQQRKFNAAPSTDNVALEDSQKSKAPPPERPKAIVCNTISSHNRKETSGSISARVDSCLPSTKVPNICRSKVGASSRLGSPRNNRSLKVRSDSTASKNAAIYRALGLDDSPLSSSENSPDVNEGKLPISQSPPDESVIKIIEAMTSFPVPHEALISPLHDSLFELSRKEKPFRETKPKDTNLMKHNKSNMLKKRGEKAKISSVNQDSGKSACTKKRKPEEKSISRVNCNQLKRKNKTEDVRSVDNHQDFNTDLGKLGSSSKDIDSKKHNESNMENKTQITLKKRGGTTKISSVNLVSGACRKKMKLEEKSIDRVNCDQLKTKSKTEDLRSVDNHRDFNKDLGKLGSCSKDINLEKHNQSNMKNKMQIALKKHGETTKISSVNQVSGKSAGTKKRKLKDWQDGQNSSALHEPVLLNEENCERSKKKTKPDLYNDFADDSMKEISKDKEPKPQSKKIISKQTPIGKELLKRNLGAPQVKESSVLTVRPNG